MSRVESSWDEAEPGASPSWGKKGETQGRGGARAESSPVVSELIFAKQIEGDRAMAMGLVGDPTQVAEDEKLARRLQVECDKEMVKALKDENANRKFARELSP